MSTPSNKFFNRYEFDEDVRDERDRLRAVNGQLLAALKLLVADVQDYEAWQRPCHALDVARAAIAEAKKATGTQP